MKIGMLALACVLVVGSTAAVAAQDDLATKIVNDPGAPQVRGAKARLVNDPNAQGGKALRVAVAKKGTNNWDSVVESAIKKPIKAGDSLILAFQARLEKGAAATATLPFNAIQLNAAPYSTIISGPVDVGPEWKLQQIKGKADKDYAADTVKATIQLGDAARTVDLGPIMVINMGQ